MRRRLQRLRREEGIALATAMMVVLLTALLSAALVQSAVNVSDTSNRDRDDKRALAAAGSGLNSGLTRTNRLLPLDWQCMSDGPVQVLADAQDYLRLGASVTVGSGLCPPSHEERGGNGQRFYYFTTPVLSASANGCNNPIGVQSHASRSDMLASGLVVLERCVTAIGAAGVGERAIRRRVQRSIYSTLRLFDSITVGERLEVTGDPELGRPVLGSTEVHADGLVRMQHAAFAGQVIRRRGAPSPQMQDVAGLWSTQTQYRPFPLAPVNPEVVDEPSENANATGISCTGPPLDLNCAASAPYDDARRTLSVRSGYTVTLAGGRYHFCDVRVEGGTLQAAGVAEVFVDHPAREQGTGDACGDDTTGEVRITAGVVNPAGLADPVSVAPNLRLFVLGAESEAGVTISGGATVVVNALMYGSESDMRITASGPTGPVVTGAISARSLRVTGGASTFVGIPDVDAVLDASALVPRYEPGDWVECQRVGSAPHRSCRGS